MTTRNYKPELDDDADIWERSEPRKLFDVTCVIGTVHASSNPDDPTPTEVAFLMIAAHGAEGTYSFPHENGSTYHVTVELEPESVPS